MDVEAQDDGMIGKIIKGDGSKAISVGTPIAIFAEEGDDLSEASKMADDASKEAPAKSDEGGEKPTSPQEKSEEKPPAPPKEEEPKKEEESKPPTEFSKDIIFASPVAKRLALERGIPLAQIKGSGPNGRILKSDVENYKPSAASATAGVPMPSGAPKAAPAAEGEYIDIPLTSMRRTIGKRLLEAKQSVPHYYLTVEINMDKVLKLREVFNTAAAAQKDAQDSKAGKLSVNDFIMKATALALAEVPEANSSWMGESIRQCVLLALLSICDTDPSVQVQEGGYLGGCRDGERAHHTHCQGRRREGPRYHFRRDEGAREEGS